MTEIDMLRHEIEAVDRLLKESKRASERLTRAFLIMTITALLMLALFVQAYVSCPE